MRRTFVPDTFPSGKSPVTVDQCFGPRTEETEPNLRVAPTNIPFSMD